MNHLNITDASGFLAEASRAAAIINARMYEIEYPDIDFGSFVPVNNSFGEWDDRYAYGVINHSGRAAWQSTFVKDVPLAEVSVAWGEGKFAEFAIGYQWNTGELAKAGAVGFSLTERKANSARYAAQLFQYEVAMIGDVTKGFGGLLNHPEGFVMPAAPNGAAAPTTAWVLNDGTGNKTPDEIVADVNNALMGPQNGSVGIIAGLLADTLLLPPAAFSYIANTPYGVTAPGKMILQVIRESNVFTARTGRPLDIREIPALSTAATVGIAGGGRAVAYSNTEAAMELPIAMDFRFYPVYQDGPFNFTTPGLGRMGGLDLKRPALRYLDGITPVPAALAALTLATATATAGAAWTSAITGETTGSIISAMSDDGTPLTVTGNNASVGGTFAAAGTKQVTLTESLGFNTRQSTVAVTVS